MEHKKNPEKDLNKKRGLYFNIGMVISLLIDISAIEWRTYDAVEEKETLVLDEVFEDNIEVPITSQPPPPPPKVEIPVIQEVPDEKEIEEEIEISIDTEMDEEEALEEIEFEPEPEPEEKVEEIFTIVEEPASFPGGLKEFYGYLKKTLKYPRQAQRMGIDGKVYLQFVVEKNGSLTDIKVVRGIGAGCDEEAVRVLKSSPKWKPGKQRGQAVRQKMTQAIVFRLK